MDTQIKHRIEQIRRGEVPEGYKNTKGGIVPDEWVEDNLGRYLSEYKKLSNDIEKYPVYSSSRQGLIPQSKYYDNREAVETCVGYKIVPTGYVTYRHMSDDDIFHFNVNRTGGKILVSSEYPVFTVSDKGELGYIIPMLNDTARFRYFCRTQKLGGTRTRLYYKNLCTYRTAFPTYPEQKKIADILSAQDKLIELQQKKIDELKRLKKVYLSKMFPKKGCNVPEIRFPGFTDAWEQRKAKGLFNSTADKGYPELPVLSATQDRGMIRRDENSINIFHDKKNESGYKRVLPGQFVIHLRSFQGGFAHSTIEGITSPAYTVFGFSEPEKHDSEYWKYVFTSKEFIRRLETVTYGIRDGRSISYDDFLTLDFVYPSQAEQTAIARYLDELSDLITLHQRKLDEEQKKKKSLMQLLLTGIVRIGV